MCFVAVQTFSVSSAVFTFGHCFGHFARSLFSLNTHFYFRSAYFHSFHSPRVRFKCAGIKCCFLHISYTRRYFPVCRFGFVYFFFSVY